MEKCGVILALTRRTCCLQQQSRQKAARWAVPDPHQPTCRGCTELTRQPADEAYCIMCNREECVVRLVCCQAGLIIYYPDTVPEQSLGLLFLGVLFQGDTCTFNQSNNQCRSGCRWRAWWWQQMPRSTSVGMTSLDSSTDPGSPGFF